MGKPKIPNQKTKYNELNKRLSNYVSLVRQIYDSLNLEAAKMVERVHYSGEKPFRFRDYPQLRDNVLKLKNRFSTDMQALIYSGTSREWKESNLVQDLVADKVLKAYGATVRGEKYKIYYQPNSDALKAFQTRKDNGLTLSQKLWNQATNYREELEYAISSAIQKGTSAVTLSKRISKYLQDFDLLQKDYKQKYGKAVNCYDCEYRSIRLARSEINMAYRTAEQKRWEQMDFVVGYEIKLSHAHHHRMPHGDICDELAGKYPKDFKWTGWHPNDMCYVVPILKTEEEFWADDDKSKNEVTDTPQQFKDWISDNKERIKKAKSRGTLPYFVKDNPSYVQSNTPKSTSVRAFESPSPILDVKYRKYDKDVLLKAGTDLDKFQEANVYLSNLYGKKFSDSEVYLKMSAELNKSGNFKMAVNVFLSECSDNLLGEVLSSVNKISTIEKIQLSSIYQPWQKRFNEYIARIQAQDIINDGYFDVYRDIEGAYNILKLSTDAELIEYGLDKISLNTPYAFIEILRKKGIKGHEIIQREFYDKFDTFVPAYVVSSGISQFNPLYNNVKLVFDERLEKSHIARLYAQYHEYGHAMEQLHGVWSKNNEWVYLYDKYAKEFNSDSYTFASKEYYGINAKNEYFKAFGQTSKTFDDKEYAIAVCDIMQSLDKNHLKFGEGGHEPDYYKEKSMCMAEFLAHASEIYWYGNPLLEKVMPSLYNEMKSLYTKWIGRIK